LIALAVAGTAIGRTANSKALAFFHDEIARNVAIGPGERQEMEYIGNRTPELVRTATFVREET
jgi:hypothetical protein